MPPDTSWFNEAKFGMFIHWGIYAVPGRGEWMLHDEKIPFDEYRSYASQFAPDEWDPQDWVNVAQQAGMRYMVLTARHHDGYCLYDSALSPDDFTAPRTAAKRDLVGEYVEAARASGQRVGLYYSLCDWHHPGWQAGPESDGWSEFIEYVHGQVRELCTNYGPLDVLWFDGGGPGCAHCWQAEKLVAMIRELQPDCLVNNRGLLPADFDTPEQKIEASEEGRLWESCLIIAHRWGYFRNEQYYKPATRLLLDMVNIANGGGNLVLNVGPTADGTIPQPQQEILREMGQWLAKHGEAVYDADRCRYGTHGTWVNGLTTAKGNTLYLHLLLWPGPGWAISDLGNTVQSARLVTTGEQVEFVQEGDRVIFPSLAQAPPDPHISVIALELDGKPQKAAE